jgi:hypothetical protein
MVQLLAVSWLLGSLVFQPGPAALRDKAVVDCFAHLLRDAKLGSVDTERAAFLVLEPEGIRCVDWPVTNDFRSARWSGPRPAGVVAVAHTHPDRFPYPSKEDIDQAERTSIPIFVLTPRMIHVIHADRRAEILARTADWAQFYDSP